MLLPHPQLLYTETVVIAERCNLETQYSAAFKEKKKRKQKGRKLLEIPRSSLTRLAETREKKGGKYTNKKKKTSREGKGSEATGGKHIGCWRCTQLACKSRNRGAAPFPTPTICRSMDLFPSHPPYNMSSTIARKCVCTKKNKKTFYMPLWRLLDVVLFPFPLSSIWRIAANLVNSNRHQLPTFPSCAVLPTQVPTAAKDVCYIGLRTDASSNFKEGSV